MTKLDTCANCADTFIVSNVNDVNYKAVNSKTNKKLCMSCGYENSQLDQNT